MLIILILAALVIVLNYVVRKYKTNYDKFDEEPNYEEPEYEEPEYEKVISDGTQREFFEFNTIRELDVQLGLLLLVGYKTTVTSYRTLEDFKRYKQYVVNHDLKLVCVDAYGNYACDDPRFCLGTI